MASMVAAALTSPVTYRGVPGMSLISHEQLVEAEGVAQTMHEVADDIRIHFRTGSFTDIPGRFAWDSLNFNDRAHAIAIVALTLKSKGISEV